MTRDELEKRNVGENLDALMNLDPRGYGVCRILYAGSRAFTGEPLTMHAAQVLYDSVKENDLVYILVGFVLLPHRVPEMDGTVSAMLLARALVMAFNAKPVIVCPSDSVQAIEKCAALAARKPAAVVSVEASGANTLGVYHNAVGKDVTEMQAKSEALWDLLRTQGVPNIAIGDLGNEIGMGTIADHIKRYVPFTDKGECQCGCGGGILSATKADNIITATCSDWGCYGLMAALAYLKKDMEILHHEEMESEVMRVAARNGFIDMTGSLLPGIDGFSTRMNVGIVSLMRQCTAYAVRFSHNISLIDFAERGRRPCCRLRYTRWGTAPCWQFLRSALRRRSARPWRR